MDALASPCYQNGTLLLRVDEIRSLIHHHRKQLFTPDLLDAFLAASAPEAFWLQLDPAYIPQYVEDMERFRELRVGSMQELKQFALLIARIVDASPTLRPSIHWASQHHESLNGKGYPFHNEAAKISLEARIIKVADVFQALAQRRPYRAPMPVPRILDLLRKMQAENEVDGTIVDTVARHLDECRKAVLGDAA